MIYYILVCIIYSYTIYPYIHYKNMHVSFKRMYRYPFKNLQLSFTRMYLDDNWASLHWGPKRYEKGGFLFSPSLDAHEWLV